MPLTDSEITWSAEWSFKWDRMEISSWNAFEPEAILVQKIWSRSKMYYIIL